MKWAKGSVVPLAALAAAILFVVCVRHSVTQQNWPQFRGPGGRGVSDATDLPERWGTSENVFWTVKIPGRGWSSPIIWGDKIFLTSATQLEGKEEKVELGLYYGGERETSKQRHRWSIYCIDFNSGKILWERTAHDGIPRKGHHLKNTLASETPVTDGKLLYAYFGNVGLFAYDFDGNPLWKADLGNYAMASNWGTGSSPVLHGDRIYVVNDNEEHSFVAAFDTATGKEVWRKDRDERSNWATPCIWENDVRSELVTCGRNCVCSYSLDGKILWELHGMSSIVIPTPFSGDGLLYVTSGFILSPLKPLFAIKPGGSGDISLEAKQSSNKFIAWSQAKAGTYNVSPIVYENTLYVLYDQGLFSAFDARTGKALYEPVKARIGPSQQFTASPWAYQGKIFCLSEEGKTVVIPADKRKFEILYENDLNEVCLATPAIARGSLFIRTEKQLYRIANKQ